MRLFHSPNKKERREQTARLKRLADLREQIEISKRAILSAQNQFEFVVEPTLIDCYIFELNAANLRYQFLLQALKKQEDLPENNGVLSCNILTQRPDARLFAGWPLRWQNNRRIPRQLEV